MGQLLAEGMRSKGGGSERRREGSPRCEGGWFGRFSLSDFAVRIMVSVPRRLNCRYERCGDGCIIRIMVSPVKDF